MILRAARTYGLPIAALVAVGAAAAGYLRINLSGSMPLGVYAVRPGATLERGDVVYACLPPAPARVARERGYLYRGPCPEVTEPVFKRVAAVPGDEVIVSTTRVAVNGRLISNGAHFRDSAGRSLEAFAPGIYRLTDTVWLQSSEDGFDSRYFGPIPTRLLIGPAWPVLVTGGFHD